MTTGTVHQWPPGDIFLAKNPQQIISLFPSKKWRYIIIHHSATSHGSSLQFHEFHQQKGWERFTDATIKLLNDQKEHLVFILWGKPAQRKEKLIDAEKHLVLKAPHPSPLSVYRGFFGSKPFSRTNDYLRINGIEPIEWCLDT